MSKNQRQIILSIVMILTLISVWWIQVCSPLKTNLDELNTDYELVKQKKNRLTNRVANLSKPRKGAEQTKKEIAQFNSLIVEGKNIEEVNAYTQIMFQKFLESKGILLQRYKELRSVKWNNYKVGLVQLQMQTSINGLADILEYINSLKKVIRIEKLTINYHKRTENQLQIVLDLGTLFVQT